MSNLIVISQKQIESRIYNMRGVQVMLDSDLAEVYQVETRALNQAVKRNIERFPEDFMFQLSASEMENLELQRLNLKSQNVMSSMHGGRRTRAYAFTEQGVAGLSAVLKSTTAAKVHVEIMRAFVAMRKLINKNLLFVERLNSIEQKQLETDNRIEIIFKALESKDRIPTQGVFFDGQVFDAYELASRIIRSAEKSIVLIDNYIDETTLTHLAKKKEGVRVLLLSKNISKQLELDVKKANEQYGNFSAHIFPHSHDRFLIIDSKDIYHLGASLKDLGKKWFAFTKMESQTVELIMQKIEKIMA